MLEIKSEKILRYYEYIYIFFFLSPLKSERHQPRLDFTNGNGMPSGPKGNWQLLLKIH